MSGGHFDYYQFHINDIIDKLEDLTVKNNSDEKDDWGYPVGTFFLMKQLKNSRKVCCI